MLESSELVEIRELLLAISRKLDMLVGDRETDALMRLSEESLGEFLDNEPDLYSVEDLKVRYS